MELFRAFELLSEEKRKTLNSIRPSSKNIDTKIVIS
jgi:hypothetical protein